LLVTVVLFLLAAPWPLAVAAFRADGGRRIDLLLGLASCDVVVLLCVSGFTTPRVGQVLDRATIASARSRLAHHACGLRTVVSGPDSGFGRLALMGEAVPVLDAVAHAAGRLGCCATPKMPMNAALAMPMSIPANRAPASAWCRLASARCRGDARGNLGQRDDR